MELDDILAELRFYGVPPRRLSLLAAKLIELGAEAAIYRPESVNKIADVEVARRAVPLSVVKP